MSKGIRQWLEQVGLGAYADLFVEHEIDLSVLPHITDAELDELGVALGARRRIQLRLVSEREATGRGAALAAAQGEEPAPADAEHRQVTVMFCDLVGSTALSGGLDPEVYRELLGRYQDVCAGEIVRYDGYVAQFLGDGVLAYFGWPRAHEDDAARAVHAGLDILEAIRALLVPGRPTEPLSVRIGIATGPAVIGDLVGASGTQPAAAVGETTNRAARVQGVAGAGAIALDEATRALLGGLFELDTLGPQVMKGIDGSPEVWRVVGERRTESRFAATRREQLTSLVGRDEELALLGRRWREAQAGEGAVVLLVGEAGIGKSRLTQALHDAVDVPHTRLLFQCSPRHTSSALHPILRQVEYVGGLDADDDPGTRIHKLDALFARSGQPPEAIVPWIAALLGIPDERHPLPALTPQRQKDRTLSALVEHIAALSTRAPVLLVVEDAHWIDPTTLELLAHLIGRIRDVPVLLIVTYRPDFRAPWVGEDHVTLLTLNRLSARDRTRMAEQLTRETGLPSEAIRQIAERSDGIPLFVEELARSALEPGPGSDSGRPRRATIPATLHDALEARFDHSAAVREVVQVGASIGRDFDHGLVAVLVSLPAPELEAALDDLVASRVLLARGTPPHATYSFRHALIQDTAYGTLLRSKREELHGRIAEALTGSLAVEECAEPELIGHHYTEAGDAERAIPFWRVAGRQAFQRSACTEAVAHLERALALARGLPDSPARARLELDLLMALNPALITLKGMAAEEVGALQAQALVLADAIGDREQAFRALFGSWIYTIQQPPIANAERITVRLAALAKATGDPGHRLQAQHTRWTTAFMLGDVAAAHRHCVTGAALYDVDAHRHHVRIYAGHDPGVCAHTFGSLSLWMLGRSEQGRQTLARGQALAAEVGHSASWAMSHGWGALCHLLEGEAARAGEAAARALASAETHGLAFADAYLLLKGVAESALAPGRPVDPRVLALCRRVSPSGLDLFRPYHLALLARLQARAGLPEEGLELLQDAFDIVAPFELHWCEAEVHRQRGELLRALGDDGRESEACFRTALALAERQGARAWALRAATSLARLEQDRGRPGAGREVLAGVYDGFTEGLDTRDLCVAKALLDGRAVTDPGT